MDSHGPISAAVIFAFTWAGLALVNNVSLKRRPGWDYVELSTFCWVRVIAFACEAAAASHPDRLRNALFEGFYDGGFFLVLVVLYGVFKKWLEEAHNHTYLPFSDLRDTAKGRLQTVYTVICWLMPVFSALGVGAAAASLSGHSNDDDHSASDALHDTSGAGFLGVLAIYIAAIALVIINVGRSKMAVLSYCMQELAPLALVALLLLLKVCFQLACQTYTAAWVNPSLFYPLSALPEILAVIILSWPGLVTMLNHTGLGVGSNETVGPVVNGPGLHGHHGVHSVEQGQSYPHGANTESYPQRPYWQGYSQGGGGGYAGQQHSQQESCEELNGNGRDLPYAQHAQQGSRLPEQTQQQSTPFQGYSQQPQGAFQHPSLPSQQPSLPFQQPQLPFLGPSLPFQPHGHLPVQPAPMDPHLGGLGQPYYPNHGQSAPSFFFGQ